MDVRPPDMDPGFGGVSDEADSGLTGDVQPPSSDPSDKRAPLPPPPRKKANARRMNAVMDRSFAWFYRMPTGRKLFLAILLALSPLALITFIANVRSAQAADSERTALMTAATNDMARRIASTLVTDENLVKRPLEAIKTAATVTSTPANDRPNASGAAVTATGVDYRALCRDIGEALTTSKGARPELYLLRADSGTPLCHESTSQTASVLAEMPKDADRVEISPDLKAVVDITPVTDQDGNKLVAMLVYPWAMMQELAVPDADLPPYNLYLAKGEDQVELTEQIGIWVPGNSLSASAPVGKSGTHLEMATRRKSLSSTDVISLIAPIGMWLLAGGLAWMLVNQLLLRPLRDMQRAVASYRPGQKYRPHLRGGSVATEITGLEHDMADLSLMVAADKSALAAGLERQTLLTREVHHRVKNNLQIIASLLNIHSRAADTPDAIETYRSIQRRVGALSAVHRNHFAELEDNEGIALRPLLSELVTGLRGTSAGGNAPISLDADPVQIEQDVAVPVAFLVTEIAELSMLAGPDNAIVLGVKRLEGSQCAQLLVQSDSLKASDRLNYLLEHRFERVLTGLSRQLRQALTHDDVDGHFRINFPVHGED